MRRTVLVLAIGILTGFLALPAWGQEPPISVKLKWAAPTTMTSGKPIPEGMLAYYNVYMCQAPIEAGGVDLDNPMVEAAHCTETIQTEKVSEPGVVSQFTMTQADSKVYFRVSAVLTNGLESKLSDQAVYPDDVDQVSNPPTGLGVDLVHSSP